jgi:hypothetical protein
MHFLGICAMDYRDGRTGLFRFEEASGVISHEVRRDTPTGSLVTSLTTPALQMMRDLMINPLPPGCRLTTIFDVSRTASTT